MEINAFAEKVKSRVGEMIGDNYSIRVCRADKNNGIIYTGLCISPDRQSVSPVIYLDSQYAMYERKDTTIEETAEYVMERYREEGESVMIDMKYFLDYERVKDSIVYKLINTGKNENLLEDVPHVEFLDLSAVFQCMLAKEGSGMASILIHNAHMKLWDISPDELYRTAGENTRRIMGYEIRNMNEVVCEIMMEENPEEFDYDKCMAELGDSVPMYVLSNKYRVEGAACMLYHGLIKDFAETLGSNLYIIPSSVHELLLLPAADNNESSGLKKMIREINDTQVKPEEVLSYSLYYYNRDKDEVCVCE